MFENLYSLTQKFDRNVSVNSTDSITGERLTDKPVHQIDCQYNRKINFDYMKITRRNPLYVYSE